MLPEDMKFRRRLVEVYFARVHPVAALSFIHKPSFMHAFNKGIVTEEYGDPLLYAMCALGAKLDPHPVNSCKLKSPKADLARTGVWFRRAVKRHRCLEILRLVHARRAKDGRSEHVNEFY